MQAYDNPKRSLRPAWERRNHRRVSLQVAAELSFDGQGHSGQTLDLSMGGVALRIGVACSRGEIVRVSLVLAGGQEIEAPAEVMRVGNGVIALRFVELNKPSLLAILSHIARE